MSVQDYRSFRELGDDYSRGMLTRAEYRSARRRLIERCVASEDTQPHGTVAQPVADAEQTRQMRAMPAPSQTRHGAYLLLLLVIGLAVAIYAGFRLSGDMRDLLPGEGPPANVETGAAGAAVLSRIGSFLDADDWNVAGLVHLAGDWSDLPPGQRALVQADPRFDMLSRRLHERLAAQRAEREDAWCGEESLAILELARTMELAWVEEYFCRPATGDTSA